jgi:hypothetical protein
VAATIPLEPDTQGLHPDQLGSSSRALRALLTIGPSRRFRHAQPSRRFRQAIVAWLPTINSSWPNQTKIKILHKSWPLRCVIRVAAVRR